MKSTKHHAHVAKAKQSVSSQNDALTKLESATPNSPINYADAKVLVSTLSDEQRGFPTVDEALQAGIDAGVVTPQTAAA